MLTHDFARNWNMQAEFVSQAFAAQRVFLEIASNSKQPAQDAFQALLVDTSKWMLEAQVHEPFFHISLYLC